MKLRISQYLTCLLLLAPFLIFDNLGQKIYFLRWIAFPAIILMLGFLLYKTRKAKWVKNVIVILFLSLSVGTVINVALPNVSYAEEEDSLKDKLKKLKEERTKIGEEIKKARAEGKKTDGWWGLDSKLKSVQKKIDKIEQEMMERCPSGQQLLEENCKDCWPCELIDMIINSVDKLVVAFSGILERGQYPLIMLAFGMLFWILFHVLKMFTTFSDSKFYSTLFKQTMICIFAATFLNPKVVSIEEAMDWFVTPVFQFGESLSNALTGAASDQKPVASGSIDTVLYKELNVDRSVCKYKVERKYQKTAFSPELRESILNMVSNLYQTIVPPVIIGQSIVCYARGKGAIGIPIVGISIPDVGMLIIGGLIVVSFTLMMVLVPFYFSEALVKVGFVVTLMPFYIVAAAFEKTRHITVTAFNTLLSAIAVFIVSCMMMVFIVNLFFQAIVDDPYKIAENLKGEGDGIKNLYEMMNVSFLMICGVSYLSFKLIKMIDPLASALMGSGYQSSEGDTPAWAASSAMSDVKFLGATLLTAHAGASKMLSVAGKRMMNAGAINHKKATEAKSRAAGHRNFSEKLSKQARKSEASAKKHSQKASESTGMKKLFHKTMSGLATVRGAMDRYSSKAEAKKGEKILKKNKRAIAKDDAKRKEVQERLPAEREKKTNEAKAHERKANAFERLAQRREKKVKKLKWYDPRNLSVSQISAKRDVKKALKKSQKEGAKGANLRLDLKSLEQDMMNETPRGLKITGSILKKLGDQGLIANQLAAKLTGVDKDMPGYDIYIKEREKWIKEEKEEREAKQKRKNFRAIRVERMIQKQRQEYEAERKGKTGGGGSGSQGGTSQKRSRRVDYGLIREIKRGMPSVKNTTAFAEIIHGMGSSNSGGGTGLSQYRGEREAAARQQEQEIERSKEEQRASEERLKRAMSGELSDREKFR